MTNKKLITYFISKYFKRDFTVFIFLAVLSATISAPIPFIYKNIIDSITSIPTNTLMIWGLIYVLLLLIGVVLDFLKERKIASFQYDVSFTVSTSIYERVLMLPYSILSGKVSGDIMKIVQMDSNNLYNIITYGVLKIVSNIIQFLINFSILIYLFGWKVVFVLIVLPVYFLLIKKGADNVEKYGYKYEQSVNNWAQDAYSPLYKLKEVKSRRLERFLSDKIKKSYSEVRKDGVKYGYISNLLYSFYSFFDKGVYIAIFLFGIYSVNIGEMSIGSLFAIIYVTNSVMMGFNDFSLTIINDFQKRLPSINRIVDIYSIEIPKKIKSPDTSDSIVIRFSDVVFSYKNSTAKLKINNMKLVRGEKYVLIGATGSGKSTFFDLVNGIRSPQNGSIKINEIKIDDISLDWWKKNVFVLLQDSTIFRGNLLENILIDDIWKGEDKVKEVILENDLCNFFKRFENGFLSELKEGNALSGGEKKMIGVVRLLLRSECPIVLIDEGKTGLDKALRKKIDCILNRILDNRLSITITHDLDEIVNFDKVIFISNGNVIIGNHNELYKNNKDYMKYILNGGNDHENVSV